MEQAELSREIEALAAKAHFTTPQMRDGTPLRCQITGAGSAVWTASREHGYHYARTQGTGEAWPEIPGRIREIFARIWPPSVGYDSMLVLRYDATQGDSLGMHSDEDEFDLDSALVTISLGADAEFRLGSLERDDDSRADSMVLHSGDAVVMSGASRRWRHQVKRVMPVMISPFADKSIRIAVSLRSALKE
jgi:alkylated DNA repair protein (DNA oxidative demethylase)